MSIVLYFFNKHPTSSPQKEKLKYAKGVLYFHWPTISKKCNFLSDIEEAAEGSSLSYLTVNENEID